MLKILLIIFIVLVLAILAIVGYAATRPDLFELQRSTSIKAPPEKIYPLIANFQNFILWSPFERDPEMKRTFSGPDEGVGAVYAFEGNSNVGAGRIEITGATPPNQLVMQLDFLRPMKATNTVTFTLVPKGDSTEVTWAMSGKNSLMAKIMHVFMNMDKMVGGSFEQGLADLKTRAEQ